MLHELVDHFKKCISSKPFPDGDPLNSFPHECCDRASKLLAVFLYAKGVVDIVLVKGPHPITKERHHFWIEVQGNVIDITADQFSSWISNNDDELLLLKCYEDKKLTAFPVDEGFVDKFNCHPYYDYLRKRMSDLVSAGLDF